MRVLARLLAAFLILLPGFAQASGAYDTAIQQPAYVAYSGMHAFFPMNETAGCSTISDPVGGTTMTVTGATCGATGLVTGDGETSISFNGTTNLISSADATYAFDYTQAWVADIVVNPNITRSGGALAWTLFGKETQTGTAVPGYQIALRWDGTSATGVFVSLIGDNGGGKKMQVRSTTTDVTNGASHHIQVWYTGTGTAAGVAIDIDGVVQAKTTIVDALAATSILTTAPFEIGMRDTNTQPYKGSMEKFVFSLGIPALSGFAPNFLHEESAYEYGLMNGIAPPTTPAGAQFILDNDVSDVGNYSAQLMMQRLMHQGANLVGNIACTSIASGVTSDVAGFNNLNQSTVPEYSFQGSTLETTQYFNDRETSNFVPIYNTNKGAQTAAVATGGTNYVVGDIVTASGGTGTATQYVVNTVSGGVITGLSIYVAGSYSVTPSSPVTVSNAHAGTQATITTTFATLRGNFANEVVGYRTILHNATDGKAVIIVAGPLTCLDNLINSPADGIDSRTGAALMQAKVAIIWIGASYFISNGVWGQAVDHNIGFNATFIASAQDVAINSPSGVPIVWWTIDQTQPFVTVFPTASPTCNPRTAPPTSASSTSNPFQDAYYNYGGTHYLAQCAWDDMTVYNAVKGVDNVNTRFGALKATLSFSGTGVPTWVRSTSGPMYTAYFIGNPATLSNTLENIEWPPAGLGGPHQPIKIGGKWHWY